MTRNDSIHKAGTEPQRNLYGRRKGPKLRHRPSRLIADLYPALALPESGSITIQQACWLEVGFGKGEHLVANAQANPHVLCIGCEPYLNGMAACLGLIEDTCVENVRLFMGDALGILERVPDASLDKIFVLHPDPWPKARHVRRRFINDEPVAVMAAKLKVGGELRVGTDHEAYMEHSLMVLCQHEGFVWTAESKAYWNTRPDDWPETRYEAWALGEGRPVWYLRFLRVEC